MSLLTLERPHEVNSSTTSLTTMEPEFKETNEQQRTPTQMDLGVANLYFGTSASNSVNRGMRYWNESNTSTKETIAITISTISIKTILTCSTICTSIGAGTGAIVGHSLVPVVGTVGGAAFGAKVGAGVGVSLGIVLSGVRATLSITTSDHYIKWIEKAWKDKVYPIFQDFLNSTDIFQDLYCGISQEIPLIPVQANGHIYEQERIVEWIRKNNGIQTCPQRIKAITIEDLTYDHDHLKKIVKRINTALKTSKNVKNTPVIKDGLTAVKTTLRENTSTIFGAEARRIFEESRKQEVGGAAFEQIMSNMFTRYDLHQGVDP